MRLGSDNKLYLDWFDVENAALVLAAKLRVYKAEPKRILAVARGGLIPATLLSHILGVRMVLSLGVHSYSNQHAQGILTAYHTEHLLDLRDRYNDADTLIVDDLFDTGETHKFLRGHFPKAMTCCLFYKEKRIDQTEHRIVSFPGSPLPDQWIVFPWEALRIGELG